MQFYVLGDLRTDDWTYEASGHSMKPENLGDAPECPVCGECVGSLPWLPPYHAEIVVHGPKLGDVVRCTGVELLVSERFRQAWQEEGLRGIENFSPLARLRVRPARLGRPPRTYFHVKPRLYGTRVDLEHSLVDYDRGGDCHYCHAGLIGSVRGFAIDESSWTGEDLFKVWGMPGRIIVTNRVRQLRDNYGLTNVNLTPVEESLWDPLYRWTPIDYSRDEVVTPNDDDDQDAASMN